LVFSENYLVNNIFRPLPEKVAYLPGSNESKHTQRGGETSAGEPFDTERRLSLRLFQNFSFWNSFHYQAVYDPWERRGTMRVAALFWIQCEQTAPQDTTSRYGTSLHPLKQAS
jgi:hypothetical protein